MSWRAILLIAAAAGVGCGWHGIHLTLPERSLEPAAAESSPTAPPTEQPEPEKPSVPPSNVIDWKTNPIRKTSTGARVFSGTVTNTDPRWSIQNVRLELQLQDGNGNPLTTIYGDVRDLGPGDRGDYMIVVPPERSFELGKQRLTWDWLLR